MKSVNVIDFVLAIQELNEALAELSNARFENSSMQNSQHNNLLNLNTSPLCLDTRLMT